MSLRAFKGLGIPNEQNVLAKTVQVVDTFTGAPLENVNVFIKGTQRGDITKADGTILVAVQHPDEVVVFSWQGATREITYKNLGSMVNIDTTMTQNPVQITTGPATDSKVNWLKWGGLAVGVVVLISMAQAHAPKKVKI